jgi:hypothetical protein
MTNAQAIRKFFTTPPHNTVVPLDELKELGKEGRAELGALAAAELGEEIDR